MFNGSFLRMLSMSAFVAALEDLVPLSVFTGCSSAEPFHVLFGAEQRTGWRRAQRPTRRACDQRPTAQPSVGCQTGSTFVEDVRTCRHTRVNTEADQNFLGSRCARRSLTRKPLVLHTLDVSLVVLSMHVAQLRRCVRQGSLARVIPHQRRIRPITPHETTKDAPRQ